MKRNTRIIQISGLKGILMVVFVGACLAAGFVAFPAIVAMKIWNYIANFAPLPLINIYQGLMLWAIVAISGFIINDRKKYLVSFKTPNELNEEEIKKLMERVRIQSQAQTLNSMVLKSSEIKSFEKENLLNDINEETVKEEDKEKEKL